MKRLHVYRHYHALQHPITNFKRYPRMMCGIPNQRLYWLHGSFSATVMASSVTSFTSRKTQLDR